MNITRKITLILLCINILSIFVATAKSQAFITVSGTITHNGSPVPGVRVDLSWETGGASVTTNNEGYYSHSEIPEGNWLNIHVRPPVSLRLAYRNWNTQEVTDNLTKNFELLSGYLLRGKVTKPGGETFSDGGWMGIHNGMFLNIAEDEWLGDGIHEGTGNFEMVLPPDMYFLNPVDAPSPFFWPPTTFDLRNSDVTGLNIVLSTEYDSPIPYAPPDASKVLIGPLNDLGESTITGSPGATVPFSRVLLVNLNSHHQADSISEADGSFQASIFAPPGSALMIKHGPSIHGRWNELEAGVAEGLNPFPGTIINVPHTHTANPDEIPFAATGAAQYFTDDDNTTRNYVGAAWSLQGAVSPHVLQSEENINISGTLSLYSPAITEDTNLDDIEIVGSLFLMMVFNSDGQPLSVENSFMSTILTPTGFPIQRPGQPVLDLWTSFEVTNLRQSTDHSILGDINISSQIPDNAPPGTYRPVINFTFNGVPTDTTWLAANVTGHYTFTSDQAALPPIKVGDPNAPHLVWRLFMDDYMQGVRGTGAVEDRTTYGLTTQIVTQNPTFYTPPMDVQTKQPITYRMEPHLPMISFTDRRIPSPPLIPFELPGGSLQVQIKEPDGTIRTLGNAGFSQSFNRTQTTRYGNDLNSGVVQLNDVYSLMTGNEKFETVFDKYGHHVVTMTGTVSDIWGNQYTGGGTYDIWVAHPLDIDSGVLPFTPFEVGDTYNPTIQILPKVDADVELTFILCPNSDCAQATTYNITGKANSYGYFSSTDSPIIMTKPGEYRVDLTATYKDSNDRLFRGTMTWGGVIETPNTPLVAHGRRGTDALPEIPDRVWYVLCRDLDIPGVSHSFNPYFNGDILWTRDSDNLCGGDALVLGASIQDTIGSIEHAIRQRGELNPPYLYGPGDFNSRIEAGEIPLFTSTNNGLPASIFRSDIDQLAYSYMTSQRPGVRVREIIAEDGASGGYWRLQSLYDNQLGIGVLGDQVNDFKFQYVSTVYRDLDAGINQYAIQGSLWILLADNDPIGSRAMPPFADRGNGGWTAEGGPILSLKGKDIDMFILPTGVRPGAVLEVEDDFSFAGHIAPTLNSNVAVKVVAPSGMKHVIHGQANKIGYFHKSKATFAVDAPGVWSVHPFIWHDGQCSGGSTIPPYPVGDVLGSENGRYYFYVVPKGTPRLDVSSPETGFLQFEHEVVPIEIEGQIPDGVKNAVVHYTISMPGYILQQGQVAANSGKYTIVFDPVALHNDFPNLDLQGRDGIGRPAGLSDTISIGLLMTGEQGNNTTYRANTITMQGNQVFIGGETF